MCWDFTRSVEISQDLWRSMEIYRDLTRSTVSQSQYGLKRCYRNSASKNIKDRDQVLESRIRLRFWAHSLKAIALILSAIMASYHPAMLSFCHVVMLSSCRLPSCCLLSLCILEIASLSKCAVQCQSDRVIQCLQIYLSKHLARCEVPAQSSTVE